MNYKGIFRVIGHILLIEAAALIPPLFVSLYDGDTIPAKCFIFTEILLAAFSGLIWFWTRKADRKMYGREGFIIVGAAWIVMSVFGALPFFFSGEIPSYGDALFESIAGFTTTGASLVMSIDRLSRGMQLWSSLTHWLGGVGILSFTLAIMRLSNRGQGQSLYLLRAEAPGPSVEKLVPKIKRHASILYGIYLSLTALCFLLLFLGGVPAFDSLCISFGTAATSGFSLRLDSMASYSIYAQNVTTVFLFLFGVNFNLYFFIVLKKFRSILKDEEFRAYVVITAASILLIFLNTFKYFESIPQALQKVSFTVVSIISSSGYSVADFNSWPEFSKSLIMILIFIGACAGSTSGGITVSRLLILAKNCYREIRKMLHPRSVMSIRISGNPLSENISRNVMIYVLVYGLIFAVSLLLVSLDNFSMETNATAVLGCLSNIGIGLGSIGPGGSFSGFSALSKFVLAADMLLGRLEFFPLLIMFHYKTWLKGN